MTLYLGLLNRKPHMDEYMELIVPGTENDDIKFYKYK